MRAGIAIARVKPTMPAHTAQFAARIVDDNTAIEQMVEIHMVPPEPPSFFDMPFAPYFAGFDVNPMPLKVGQLTTFRAHLTNRRGVPVEIKLRLFATLPNIGLGWWPEVGETALFVLQPGERREVVLTWTPTLEVGHVCVQAQVWGRELPKQAARRGILDRLFATVLAQAPQGKPATSDAATMETRQRNLGTVSPNKCLKKPTCETIAKLQALFPKYEGKWTEFPKFAREFDHLLAQLSNKDLACRFDEGSQSSFTSGPLGQIHRARFGLKTIDTSLSFPSSMACDASSTYANPTECEDYKALQQIRSLLAGLSLSVGCPQPATPPPSPEPKPCASNEVKPSDGSKEAASQIVDALKTAMKDVENELRLHPGSEGVRARRDQYKKLIAFWEKIQAASCVPGNVLQNLEEIKQGREGACENLCQSTFVWMKAMGGTTDNQRTAFMLLCTQACNASRR